MPQYTPLQSYARRKAKPGLEIPKHSSQDIEAERQFKGARITECQLARSFTSNPLKVLLIYRSHWP